MFCDLEEIPQEAGVYLITNNLNNRKYYGHSKNLRNRARTWKSAIDYWTSYSAKFNDLAKYYGKYCYINGEMKKDLLLYPFEHWEFKIIKICKDKNEAEVWEKKFIVESEENLYNIVYNAVYDQFSKSLIEPIQLELPLVF